MQIEDKKLPRFAAGIFLISLASLSFEVALSYQFAFMFWFFVSFVVITVAMFGLGLGSLAGYFLFKQHRASYHKLLFYSSVALAAAMLFSMAVIALASKSISVQPASAFDFSSEYILLILLVMGSASLPFVFAGMCISLALGYPGDRKAISYIYFADLIGAGIGSFAIIALLPRFSVEEAIVVSAVLSIAGAVLFAEKMSRAQLKVVSIAALISVAFFFGSAAFMPEATGDKFLSKLKANGAKVLHTQWTPISRVDVVEYADKTQVRFIENAEYPITVSRGVRNSSSGSDPRYFMFEIFNSSPRNMLAIGAGGGVEVAMAIEKGVEKIAAVELNEFIIQYMRGALAEYSNYLYFNPQVEIYVEDGRTFVHRGGEKFQLIENGVLGSSGVAVPSTSLLTFQDVYVYTVEANEAYWRRMSSEGATLTIIYGLLDEYNSIDAERGVTSFLLRQYSTVKEALARNGIDAKKHVMLFRYVEPAGNLQPTLAQAEYTLIFKQELSREKAARLIEEAKKYNLEPLYAPYYEQSIDIEEYLKNLPANKDVSPATDDKPFFYFTDASPPAMLFYSLLALLALTFLALVLPVYLKQKIELNRENLRWLFYFFCLGAGYILLEVALIQKFILFLGQPAYAFQVVLFSMLVFSGFGSYASGALSEARLKERMSPILIAAVLTIFVWSAVLPKLLYGFLHLELLPKVALTIAFLAPLAFVLGMPFPVALRLVAARSQNSVVWMYGLNACGSVIGGVAAMIVALALGFSYALYSAGVIYLAALLVMLVRK